MKRTRYLVTIHSQIGSITLALVPYIFSASSAAAAFLPVYGGPTYNPITQNGYTSEFLGVSVSDAGVVAAYADKIVGGTGLGTRPFRWDASGSPATELGNLGTSNIGYSNCFVYAVNATGTLVGGTNKWVSGDGLGSRAVRWDSPGTAPTELGNLGTSDSSSSISGALAVNATGTAVGWAEKYVSGRDFGNRAVRWDASGTAATELGNLGIDVNGRTFGEADAINNVGTAAGYAFKYSDGTFFGQRAVRWEASGTAATELGNLGTDVDDRATSNANAINSAGTAVGFAQKFSGGTLAGDRAVRWDASGTAATELVDPFNFTTGIINSYANAISDGGVAVGYVFNYISDANFGNHAVRWDTSGAATKLGGLGAGDSETHTSQAYDINTRGIAAGFADYYAGDTYVGQHAVLWKSNAVALDLNTLIDPNLGWTLSRAQAISDTNWVAGIGDFDPDGAGPLEAYQRAFLINVSSAVVPEPSSIALLSIGLIGRARRRRKR